MGRILQWLKKTVHAREEGITGLETAIILIAFVMVASVFAYVVVSAGLYSSQKAKQAVTASLEAIMSVVELKGDVIAKVENGEIKQIYLFVGTPAAGGSVDFTDSSNSTNTVVISYMDSDMLIPTVNWSMQRLSDVNADNLLDPAELFLITVDLSTTANLSIGAYEEFTLEVKPPGGPVLSIERTMPRRVTQYVNLH
ncbi:MAG: archaellin/type IV pilin N-terminal domain-containing protein [Chloroflexota bacterium]